MQIIRLAKQDTFKGANEIRNEVFPRDDLKLCLDDWYANFFSWW